MEAPGPELTAGLRQPLLPVHIAVALAGLAVFGVATAVAGVYLVAERMLKGKRFGPFFRRVPSLELLDDLNRRLVAWGFIALSLTLLTGAWVQARMRPEQRWPRRTPPGRRAPPRCAPGAAADAGPRTARGPASPSTGWAPAPPRRPERGRRRAAPPAPAGRPPGTPRPAGMRAGSPLSLIHI